ncbi:hypothetical protein B0H67DRAFT_111023 [Lasiosphaeris hirsuta]|uniref:Uncharacterized protein n=1 Tax=Lasiosphaeris hirsuta TaxID=260670 RepID=A0AA40E4G1_9PEZI|nr:hypothetical protein B0H67DRAFT_111023 [Lasiosphaeris hirsuta]
MRSPFFSLTHHVILYALLPNILFPILVSQARARGQAWPTMNASASVDARLWPSGPAPVDKFRLRSHQPTLLLSLSLPPSLSPSFSAFRALLRYPVF